MCPDSITLLTVLVCVLLFVRYSSTSVTWENFPIIHPILACMPLVRESEVDIQYVLVIYHLRTMFAKHFEIYLKVKFNVSAFVCVYEYMNVWKDEIRGSLICLQQHNIVTFIRPSYVCVCVCLKNVFYHPSKKFPSLWTRTGHYFHVYIQRLYVRENFFPLSTKNLSCWPIDSHLALMKIPLHYILFYIHITCTSQRAFTCLLFDTPKNSHILYSTKSTNLHIYYVFLCTYIRYVFCIYETLVLAGPLQIIIYASATYM